jgi:hypothetical protein
MEIRRCAGAVGATSFLEFLVADDVFAAALGYANATAAAAAGLAGVEGSLYLDSLEAVSPDVAARC